MVCKRMMKYIRAVTLLELIVVLTIVAILAVVGFPSYQTYLVESRRSDAINALRANQLTLENYMQQNGTTPASGSITLITTSEAGYYNITYTQVDSNNYKLVATAVSGKSQANDTGCTTITLISQMDTIFPPSCH